MNWPGLVAQSDTTLLAAFGMATTYDPATGQAITVRGIFDAAYVRAEVGEAGVSSVEPMVFYRLADLPVDPETDTPAITIGGVTYRVRECEKDGQGGVQLFLHRT